MYIPKAHKGLSIKASLAFARKYSFAIVSGIVNEQIEIVHIPVELETKNDKILITSHLAKGNKLSEAIHQGTKATVVFTQPHAYISSSWYDHINVPTWNYIAIHMKGVFRILEGQELMQALETMVEHYESGRENRYKISDMPEDMLQAHLNGLTAFEIEVEEIESNYKLSQNRNDKNYSEIIEKLKQSDFSWEREIAEEMLQLRPKQKNEN